MVLQQTLSIIKPDAVGMHVIGGILSRFEQAGLRVAAAKMVRLSRNEAETFYRVHTGKHFFESLVSFITSGPVVVLVLEGENAIAKNRELMGATDPRKAVAGTIRGDFAKNFGENIERNVVHGSDAPETAAEEIAYFFAKSEIFSS